MQSKSIEQPSKPAPRNRRPGRVDIASAVNATRSRDAAKNVAAVVATPKQHAPGTPHTQGTKLSALDAAAQVVGALGGKEAIEGITAITLIERMTKQKLWTSPDGKTPHATLYAAMVREIKAKGPGARFRRVSPGHFSANTVKPSRKAKA